MTFTEAAAEVLRLVGRPLHYKEITAYAIEKSLLSHVGKSPEVTMGARLASLFKKQGDDNPLVRIRPGVFALKQWEADGQLKQMLKPKKAAGPVVEEAVEQAPPSSEPLPLSQEPTSAEEPAAAARPEPVVEPVSTPAQAAPEPVPAPPAPVEPPRAHPVVERARLAPRPAEPSPPAEPPRVEAAADARDEDDDDDEELVAPDADEAVRHELVASANSAFDEEDDDDQPIFGEGGDRDGTRRRRRRRRRSKNGAPLGSNGAAYSASPVATESSHVDPGPAEPRQAPAAATGPVVFEVNAGALDASALDDLGGRDMADAIASVLGTFDRGSGPVSLRQLAELAQRRGRLAGDLQQLQSQIAASVRADNMRRSAQGMRPRFRFAGGRIAMTDWLLGPELARMEQEAIAAVERYREASRKAFVRKLQDLPGHAFVELVLLVLERIGVHNVRSVRRAGIPANEAHFAALQNTGAQDLHTALVIRRDGREVGRERVTELRGSLHHYGPAAVGWIITAGQVLSGAREEAGAVNQQSVGLLDGIGVARLCEQHDVAVVRSTLPISIPDLDVLEALRSS